MKQNNFPAKSKLPKSGYNNGATATRRASLRRLKLDKGITVTTLETSTSPFNLLDVLQATMAIGYALGARGESVRDAADVGELHLAQILIECDSREEVDVVVPDLPTLEFSAEWRSVIDDMLRNVVPNWSQAEPMWGGHDQELSDGLVLHQRRHCVEPCVSTIQVAEITNGS